MTQQDLDQIQALVNGAHKVLIFTHKDPSVDSMASALAIYLAMLKAGKDATVVMENTPLVEVANLVGVDQVKTTLGTGKNLVITYQPYNIGDFEHITYADDPNGPKDVFRMSITLRDGYVPDPKNFTFNMDGGGVADLIFTVDVLEPAVLGSLYDPKLFTAPVINIDNHDPNKDYGRFNLVEPEAASISEITTFFLRAIGTQMDTDMAGNLYQGIASATNNFQAGQVAAATFEAAAICLRAGAKTASGARTQPSQATATPVAPATPTEAPTATPQPVPNQRQDQTPAEVPADWTQPKAYRGTSVV